MRNTLFASSAKIYSSTPLFRYSMSMNCVSVFSCTSIYSLKKARSRLSPMRSSNFHTRYWLIKNRRFDCPGIVWIILMTRSCSFPFEAGLKLRFYSYITFSLLVLMNWSWPLSSTWAYKSAVHSCSMHVILISMGFLWSNSMFLILFHLVLAGPLSCFMFYIWYFLFAEDDTADWLLLSSSFSVACLFSSGELTPMISL